MNFFSDMPLNNESSPQAQLPTSFAISQTDDEGLLQLEPPSEYSFSLHDQENLDDIFESFPFWRMDWRNKNIYLIFLPVLFWNKNH